MQQKLQHIEQQVQRINQDFYGDMRNVECRVPSVDQRFQEINQEVVQRLQDYEQHKDQKLQDMEQAIKELKVLHCNNSISYNFVRERHLQRKRKYQSNRFTIMIMKVSAFCLNISSQKYQNQ